MIAILDPIAHFFRRAAAHISSEVRFRANQFAEFNKFMRAETIVFEISAPVNVHALRALRRRADSIAPVIIIRETSTGPPQHGNSEIAEIFNGLLAISICVGDWRIFADPEAAVNAGAQMFREVAV